jgi:hypothetical protein
MRYSGNVYTEPLPNNDRGIFTQPLPSNDKVIFTDLLPSNDREFLPGRCLPTMKGAHTHTHSNVIS